MHSIASAHHYSQDSKMKNKTFKIFYNFIITHADNVRLLAGKVKLGYPPSNPIYIWWWWW